MPNYKIRAATRADAPAWIRLVIELARFEELAPPTTAARRRLVNDAFGRTPRIEVMVATGDDEVVAYAIIAWTYSSFLAKPTLWLEDLYITPAHRGTGLAQKFLRRLAARAHKEGAGRIEGIVLTWNTRARRFYKATGADLKKEWTLLRYDEAAIAKILRARA